MLELAVQFLVREVYHLLVLYGRRDLGSILGKADLRAGLEVEVGPRVVLGLGVGQLPLAWLLGLGTGKIELNWLRRFEGLLALL